jgi:hypothetical protein
MVRATEWSCRSGALQAKLHLVAELPEQDKPLLRHAMAERGATVGYTNLHSGFDAANWLRDKAQKFTWKEDNDLTKLIEETKGMPLIRGRGTNSKVAGGMMKGKDDHEQRCPFCGAELSNCLGDVPASEIEYENGIPVWRPPPCRGP